MRKAIVAAAILAMAAGPALAKGHGDHGRHGRPRHHRGPNPALCFPYGETAVAAATAFSIVYDSIKGYDRYVPVPVAQPVPVPVYPPQPVYYPPCTPLAYNAPVWWPPAQW